VCNQPPASHPARKYLTRAITDTILASHTTPSSTPLIPTSIPPPQPCPGVVIQWDLGSLYHTYPFPIHDPTSRFKPGYILLSVDPATCRIHVRSLSCTGTSLYPALPCSSCQTTIPLIKIVLDRARTFTGKLSRNTMSHVQPKERLYLAERKLKKE